MKTIGIIGGGQLGFMIIEYGIMKIIKSCFLDVTILVLDENIECSCASLLDKYDNIQIVVGNLMDINTVNDFVDKCDIVTWEIEHFVLDSIIHSDRIIPNVNILKTIQNKIFQKQFYTHHDIPTAKYTFGKCGVDFDIFDILSNCHRIEVVSKENNTLLLSGRHLVVKQPLNGYDGRAVEIISGSSDVRQQTDILIEEFIDNKIELSVIVASDAKSELYVYECIGMDFHSKTNILDKCYPAIEKLKELFRHKFPCGNDADSFHTTMIDMADNAAEKVENRAIELAKKVAKAYELKSGLLAVEMFYCIDNDTLLVNEVAPR